MSRAWAVLLAAVLISGVCLAERPPGQQALFDAQDKVKGKTIEEAAQIYREEVIEAFPGTLYAGQALINIGSLHMTAKQWDEAIKLNDQVLKEYGSTYLASQCVRRRFAILNYGLGKPQEALSALEADMETYLGRVPAKDLHWFAAYRYDAHKTLGDPEKALQVLEEAMLTTPQVLDSWEVARRYVKALQAAKRHDEAQCAAKAFYACCKFAQADIKNAADLVVRSLTSAGEVFKANGFVAAQDDPDRDNPLKDVPWPQIDSDEKWQALMQKCKGDAHLQIVALLHFGDYEQALELAVVRLGEARGNDAITASVNDIARCFKAKDLNLTRANQFIEYAKTGEGDNPLREF